MNRYCYLFFVAITAFAADSSAPPIGKVFDQQLTSAEHEIVPLVEAMPQQSFNFAPTEGSFKGVRTFSQQATHLATVVYEVAAAIKGEKLPFDAGATENGPLTLKSKDEIVRFMKDAFAYAHKAMASITPANYNDQVAGPPAWGGKKVSLSYLASVALWHSYDHYGQMVVYARMQNVIPPASRTQ